MNPFEAEPGLAPFVSHYAAYVVVALLLSVIWFEFWFWTALRAFDFAWDRLGSSGVPDRLAQDARRLVLLRELGFRIARIAPVWFSSRNPPRKQTTTGLNHSILRALTMLATAPIHFVRWLGRLFTPAGFALLAAGVWFVRPSSAAWAWQHITGAIDWLTKDRAANLLLSVALGAVALRFLATRTLLREQVRRANRIEALGALTRIARAHGDLGFEVEKLMSAASANEREYASAFVRRYSSAGLELTTFPPAHERDHGNEDLIGDQVVLKPAGQHRWVRRSNEPDEPEEMFRSVKDCELKLDELLDLAVDHEHDRGIPELTGWLCPTIRTRRRRRPTPPPYATPPRASSILTPDEMHDALSRSIARVDRWLRESALLAAECHLISERAVPDQTWSTKWMSRFT